MKKFVAVLAILVLLVLLFFPFRDKFTSTSFLEKHAATNTVAKADVAKPSPIIPLKINSVNDYFTRLSDNGAPIDLQSVLVQTLDGKILVERNADTTLNPASVMKLATSYLALKHFQPDHKFKTIAYTTGVIDESKQVLYGDVVVETEGDPNFTLEDAANFGSSIRSQGVKKVEGALIIKGPMLLRHSSNLQYVYSKLRAAIGIKFSKPTITIDIDNKLENEGKILLAVHYSQPLKDLLLFMNSFSDNYYAEHLGLMLGGAKTVETELEKEFKLKPEQLEITHTSGLDYNRITPRASIKIFQKMIALLKSYQMKVEDIMPIVGVDSGTLATRLVDSPLLGAVAAKTGTLHVTDDGASILQGVMYTKEYGVVLFAIFNMVGKVPYFRQEQDILLNELVNELKITPRPVRLTNIFPDEEPILTEITDFPEKKSYGKKTSKSKNIVFKKSISSIQRKAK